MTEGRVEVSAGDETDARLLRRFIDSQDETAFTELVRRHGRLVWGVCRRRLSRQEDAEDAFQATFLLLAVKAGSLRRPEALAGWLHRTASRAAIRVASATPREPPDEAPTDGLDAFAELARREAAAAVDEELVRLPGRYRDPIVLFHFEGLDRRQVADRLGVSEPTVKARLTRGRSLLRSRLARRGVALPLLLPLALDPVPAEAATAACRWAASVARSGLSPFDLLTVPAKGLPTMLTWFTNKAAAATLVGVVCVTLFLATRGPASADGGTEPATGEATLVTTLSDEKEKEPEEIELASAEPPSNQQAPSAMSSRSISVEIYGSQTEEKIRAALDDETQLVFPNTPLRTALEFLADNHGINIVIDEQAIAEEGVSIDDNVDFSLKGISLGSGLELLLEPYGLTYVIDDEVMKITTQAVAEGVTDTRAYGIAPLLDEQTGQQVADLLSKLVESEDKEPRILPFRDYLFVTGTWADHKRIGEVLNLMRVARNRPSGEPSK